MESTIKTRIIDRTMFDKDIDYMKEMQEKLAKEENKKRKEQEKKNDTLIKPLEKERLKALKRYLKY